VEGRPFLKWVGGKRQLLPELLERVPEKFETYYEPFVGGGALFFALSPKRAILSDMNERLIRTYLGVRNHRQDVVRLLKGYSYSEATYYAERAVAIDKESNARLAAWFIFINKTGYNGLYRVNSKNLVNVPFGRHANPNICDEPTIISCSAALRRARIVHKDFETVLRSAKRGDFVYLDPPYEPISATSHFTSYTAGGFGWKEQVRLHHVVQQLKSRGVQLLVSNSDSPQLRELYADFSIDAVSARRSVNSNRSSRGAVGEILIT
jgi:DNA adenine methylase